MQFCNSLQTDNHASTPPLSFLQAGCPSCHPTNSVQSLKANSYVENSLHFNLADFPVNFIKQFVSCLYCLHFTKNIAYRIPEMLILRAYKVAVMAHSGNLCVFNFAIPLRSRKWDALEIFVFYRIIYSVYMSLLFVWRLSGRDADVEDIWARGEWDWCWRGRGGRRGTSPPVSQTLLLLFFYYTPGSKDPRG